MLGQWGNVLLGGNDERSITHQGGAFKTLQALVKFVRTTSIAFRASAEYFGVLGEDGVVLGRRGAQHTNKNGIKSHRWP